MYTLFDIEIGNKYYYYYLRLVYEQKLMVCVDGCISVKVIQKEYLFIGRWYYIKYVLFLLFFYWRQKQDKNKTKQHDGRQNAGYGKMSYASSEMMEQSQPLTGVDSAVDCVYFSGMNKDGMYLITHLCRRQGRKAEIWLSMLLPDGRFYQSPIHPATMVYNVDDSSFFAAGLKMECLEPMKRWKVSYNGLLRTLEAIQAMAGLTKPDRFQKRAQTKSSTWSSREGLCNEWTKDKGKTVHVSFSFIWNTFSDVFNFDVDINKFLLADAVARETWTEELFQTLKSFRAGYVSLPNATMMPISSTDLDLSTLGEHHNPPDCFNFSFTADGLVYNVKVTSVMHPMYYHEEDWGNVVYEKFSTIEVNGIKGSGISEFAYRRHNSSCPVPQESSLPLLAEPRDVPSEDVTALVLAFTQPGCCTSRLVGGKGCQLGLLTQLQSKDFVIPEGFCLTITSFENHIRSHPELVKHIQMIEDIASNKCPGTLEDACKVFYGVFVSTEMAADVRRETASELIKQFGSNLGDIMFAVRSSAAGEDGAEMSAAGQMDTFLGVKGLHQLFEAIIKCWASQFAVTAVQYRRQHGQPIRCGMGVVIQKMVPADVAGVLFTCDPVTGNPACMVINANYGLGESVVSGSTEPDMITINRSWDNQLVIGKKQVGHKNLQMVLKDSGGVESKNVSGSGDCACCLSDDLILQLGKIGIDLEKRFSDARDIEFAIKDGIIHLLQARPVTSQDQESDFDVMHEFDAALCSDTELITTANIGEMMPSAMSTLTLNMFMKVIDFCGQMMYKKSGTIPRVHDFLKFLYSYNNMGFINLHMMMCLNQNTTFFGDKSMAELSILGETREDFKMEEVIQYHGRRSFLRRLINGYKFIMSRVGSLDRVKKWDSFLETFTIVDRDWSSACELYAMIDKEKPNYAECWFTSMTISSWSAIWATALMAVLSRGKHVWTTQHYSDVAMLLSQCEDVYSADVPAALQEAADWLITNSNTEAGRNFKEFLSRHGHRCIKEAELLEKSWQTEPHKVISVIQTLLSSRSLCREKKIIISVDEAIQKMKTPTTFFGRLILRWTLPRARRAVGCREFGKSVAVKMNEVFKQAYWKLASLMVREGRLPKEELLFFLTHEEIGQLLEKRCGRLVTRAQRRYKLYPKQLEMKYQIVNRGRPVPAEDCMANYKGDFSTTFEIQGMPVSQGVIQGKARVIRTLEEAATIECGEILVVPFTDVGWSPYFPLISGLVTEMGGLLSHGAVVAREYGLPCIVNAQNATFLLKSGDEVILNGTMGTLKLLK
ncbi:hypothetical protein LSH36_506g02049 [Paralvinella palmiformis]|uniref:Phosphoenolpyruvate synthase n=1 Tax=Paralvinella palmiformis TaxID=53620 RepID=A0AAD9MYE6_9ANNE|nr:hypothetical protein LSH36_506g02049 [Paralvinella palmiformis]